MFSFCKITIKHFIFLFVLFFSTIKILMKLCLPNYPFVFVVIDLIIIALWIFLCKKIRFSYCIPSNKSVIDNKNKSVIIAISLAIFHITLQFTASLLLDFIKFDKNAIHYCIFIVLNAIMQEILFKGFLFTYLYKYRKWNYWCCAAIVSVFFSYYHGENYSGYFIIDMISFTMFYFWNSLAFIITYHVIHNMIWIFFPIDEILFQKFIDNIF